MSKFFEIPPESFAINASAGFGKTENLGKRILAMLLSATGQEELLNSIVAMTFTRAAAGEIYERLLTIICAALETPEKIVRFEDELKSLLPGISRISADGLKEVLQLLVREMARLKIGTIDGFMASIVQSCPFELGLPGSAALINPEQISGMNSRIIRNLFSGDSNGEFADSCREAVVGAERKGYFDAALEMIEKMQRFYYERNDEEVWNHFPTIPPIDQPTMKNALLIWKNHRESSDFELGRSKLYRVDEFDALLEKCCSINIETRFNAGELKLLRLAFGEWDEILSGQFNLSGYSFTAKLPLCVRESVRVLMKAAADLLIFRASRRTAGMRCLFVKYNFLYTRNMIQQGRLAFSDLARLLTNPENEWVQDINFRLNGKLHHWLIDEFQDTSREQLKVFNSIIDDVHDGENSLCIVGDVKQAIYNWRSGDRRLMAFETRKFNLIQQPLTRSFRYGESICEALNLIFSASAMGNSLVPENVRKAWLGSDTWCEHNSARKHDDAFEAIQLVATGKDESDSTASPCMVTAEIIVERIKKFGVVENRLECGILMRNNKKCVELRDEMVALNPIFADILVVEGNDNIGSDKLISAILSLLVYIQHPADTLAKTVAEMNQMLYKLVPHSSEDFRKFSEKITLSGFSGTVEFILENLELENVVDAGGHAMVYNPYSDGDMDIFLNAAKNFDAAAEGGDAIEFREFVNNYRKSDVALAGKIRIMTIHHSKGLSFDVVFVPMISGRDNNWLSPDTDDFVAKSNSAGDIEWCIYSPKKEGLTNPELKAAILARHDESVFEELCVNYVALTRAKIHCSLIMQPMSAEKEKCDGFLKDGKRISSYYARDFIYEALFKNHSYEDVTIGNYEAKHLFVGKKWWESYTPKKAQLEAGKMRILFDSSPRLTRIEPSGKNIDLDLLFTLPEKGKGAEVGNRIHAYFEKNDLNAKVIASLPEIIKSHIAACRSNPLAAALFEADEVWREKSYEVVIGGKWVSGRFDRVNFYFDTLHRPIRAVIVDYKSDNIAASEAVTRSTKYVFQLEQYKKALEIVTGLSSKKIEAYLLFTSCGEVVKV